jgi:hypothetical protein
MSEVDVPYHAEKQEHKRVGIFIAVVAVIMAVISALARNAANEIIVEEVQASNGFAWYQAKRQRGYMTELEIRRARYELAGNLAPAQRKQLEENTPGLEQQNAKYAKENDEIRRLAESHSTAAKLAEHKHHWFEYGEICLHIAVVLCSLTLLTDQKLFFWLGIIATVGGVLIASVAFFVREPLSEKPGTRALEPRQPSASIQEFPRGQALAAGGPPALLQLHLRTPALT